MYTLSKHVSTNRHRQHEVSGAVCEQAVVITDPVLATQILRNKAVDKLRFMYSFLDVVSLSQACMTTAQQDVQRD